MTIVAEPTTTIVSNGGSFNLQIGDSGTPVPVIGSVEGNAKDIYTNALGGITLVAQDGILPDALVGTNYNYDSYLTVPTGYTADVVWKYYDITRAVDQTNPEIDKPTEVGYYGIRAYGKGDVTVNPVYSNMYYFSLTYLTLDEDTQLTISGVDEDGNAEEKVTVTAPEGFTFRLAGSDDEEYVSSMTFTEEELFVDGVINDDLAFEFKRTDGALTGFVSYEDVAPGLAEITFGTPEKEEDEAEEETEEEEEKEEEKEE